MPNTLYDEITDYYPDRNTKAFWARIHKNYSDDQLFMGMLDALDKCSGEQIARVCNFIRDVAAPSQSRFITPKLIDTLEKIVAGDNVRKAHSAVFTLGRVASRKTVPRLQAILTSNKHRDPELIHEIESVINLLSKGRA